jgi:hypothetical protein
MDDQTAGAAREFKACHANGSVVTSYPSPSSWYRRQPRPPNPGEKGAGGRETELLTNSAWEGVRAVRCATEDAARTDSPIERRLPGKSSVSWCRQGDPARCAVRAPAPEPVVIRKGASSAARRTAVCARNSWVSSDPPAPLRSSPPRSCRGECSQASGCTSTRRHIHNPREQWTKRLSQKGAAPKTSRCLACKRTQSLKQRSIVKLRNANRRLCHIDVSESPP